MGRMTVCGLGFCHDIRAPGGQAQRECCHVRLRASKPAGHGRPRHVNSFERLGSVPPASLPGSEAFFEVARRESGRGDDEMRR